MNPSEEQRGTAVPPAGEVSSTGSVHPGAPDRLQPDPAAHLEPAVQPADPLDRYEDGYPHEPEPSAPTPVPVQAPVLQQAVATLPRRPGGGGKTPPPPSGGDGGDGGGGDEDDDGMLRMSFLQHLEELRNRIIRSLIGV